MLKPRLCAVLAIALIACTDSSPPTEEECAPLKAEWKEQQALDRAQWEKAIRQQVEAEVRRSIVASGPTIGERERKALDRAASPGTTNKPGDDEPVIEEHPAPNKLTSKDREALADDPASNGRVPKSVPDEKPAPTPTPDLAAPSIDTNKRVDLESGTETLKLTELVIALGVENRQPISPGSRFKAGPQQFFCYTVYDSGQEAQTSTHVWRYKQKVLSRVELNVGKSPSWRTWSRHRARPNATGDWSCEVLDAQGKRLGKAHFKVDNAP